MEYSGEIKSLADLHRISKEAATCSIKLSGAFQYYRGHGCSCYKLLSYISRFFSEIDPLEKAEQKIISDLKLKTEEADKKEYFYIHQNSNGFDQDWYWLTQAQHLGIPTRLMDWTLCSEVALYFAVSDKSCKNNDGDLWIFFVPDEFNIYNQTENLSNIKPFQADKDLFINIPIHWSNNYEKNEPQRNMVRQQGEFFIRSLSQTLTPLEDEAYYKKYLLRYRIPATDKEKILQELTELNYSNETIYKTVDEVMKLIKDKLIEENNLTTKKCSS
jgi:FRG domain